MQYKINQQTIIATSALVAVVATAASVGVVVWATRSIKKQKILDYMNSNELNFSESYSFKIDMEGETKVLSSITFQQDIYGVYLLFFDIKIYIVEPTENGLTGIFNNTTVFISDFQSIEGHIKKLGLRLGDNDVSGGLEMTSFSYKFKSINIDKKNGIIKLNIPDGTYTDDYTNLIPCDGGFYCYSGASELCKVNFEVKKGGGRHRKTRSSHKSHYLRRQ